MLWQAAIGGDMLAVQGANTKEIAKLIACPNKIDQLRRRFRSHASAYPYLDAMILFQWILEDGCSFGA